MRKKKSPFKLTFSDVLEAAILIAKQKGHPKGETWKKCPACKETLKVLNAAKKRLKDAAYGDNLVWPAYNGKRKLYIGD